jgi:sugar phosphate isomerase/epimerase
MSRPVMLFTGQWADLTLEDVAKKASAWGFDGLELACWGDHFDVDRAISEDGYIQSRWDILNKYELKCAAISTHLVGQCVADDPIDERHNSILPPACGAMVTLRACASAVLKKLKTPPVPLPNSASRS